MKRSAFDKTLLLDEQIFTLKNFLRPEECTELIDRSLSSGFKPSPPSGGGHGRTGREDARNNKYTVIEDAKLAEKLFSRIRNDIPQDLTFLGSSNYFSSAGGAEWKPVGVIERLRFYRYDRGEVYPEHMDGSFRRTITDANGQQVQQQSFLTLLVYLNEEFEGGQTQFWPDKQHCRFLRDVELKIPKVVVTPTTGTALLNSHCILHQGDTVTSGTKYVMRTDVIYQRPLPLNPKLNKFVDSANSNAGKASKATEWEKLFEPSCKMYHD